MFDELNNNQKEKQDNNQNNQEEKEKGKIPGSLFIDKQEKPKSIAPPPPAVIEFEQRIKKLEKTGRQRSKKRKIYSGIGIFLLFLIGMAFISAGYYFLTEIIDITGKTQESVANIPDKRKGPEDKVIIQDEWKRCNDNSDCTETQKACCSCYNGGEQTAINRNYLDDWNDLLENRCQNIDCMAVENCQLGKVICENNRCEFAMGTEKSGEEICVKEGEMILITPTSTETIAVKCCRGLRQIISDTASYNYCTNCGDGICRQPEAVYNCPEDCEEVEFSDKELVDSDNDGLFDDEEAQYGADPNNPDTDGDGYLDGEEVKSGYNPNGSGKL